MQIGALARRFGLNPKTIRYYEGIDLLPQPERDESGYRRYGNQAIERLGLIQRAKMLGLSLEEIRDILSLQARGQLPCSHVLRLIDAKISAIDRRIADLQAFRSDLDNLRSVWEEEDERLPHDPSPQHGCICPIIEQQAEVTEHPASTEILEPRRRRQRISA